MIFWSCVKGGDVVRSRSVDEWLRERLRHIEVSVSVTWTMRLITEKHKTIYIAEYLYEQGLAVLEIHISDSKGNINQ